MPEKIPLVFRNLNTKTDQRHLLVGDLVSLYDVDLSAWPKLKKRPGNARLAVSAAGALASTFKKQLFVGTGAEAFALAQSTGNLIDKGILETMSLSALPVRRDSYAQSTVDCALHSAGVAVYTWETTAGGAQYSVFDSATGQPIVSAVTLSATASKPKALALGSYVVVLWYDTGTNRLRFIAIPAMNPTSPTAAADFATDPATSQIFDATVIGQNLVVAYANSGASNKISLRSMTAQLSINPEVIPTTTEVFNTCCAVFGDASGNVWVAYYTGTAVKLFVYDRTLTALVLTFTSVDAAPGTVRNITGIVPSGSTATVLYEASGSASYNALIKTAALTLAGAVSGLATLVRSVGLASKPFFYLGRVHFLAAYQSALQSSYFLLSGSQVVAKLAPNVGGGLTAKSILPEASSVVGGVYSLAYLQADQLSSVGGNVFTQAGVMSASFDFTSPPNTVELSDNLHVAGGMLSMYDGSAVVEHGFHLYPENLTATPSGVGLTGQYQYAATWELMDAQGLLHQSGPSPVLTLNPANQGYQLTIPTLRLTAKATPISVVIWRTQANQSVFFRLTSISAPLLNSTTADTVTFTDNASDASIGGNAQLVFNPDNASSELPPLAAPALSYVWRYRNRIAGIPAENPYQWIYSKAYVAGVPIEFNDQNLFQSVSQDGGPLTCGLEMDEKNILFTASRIYYVVGDGPAPNGTSPDYGSAPQNVPSDVGCANRRSLVLTPLGIMFQAANGKGIYLLSRGLSLEYIGAPVEAFNGANVTAAKLAQDDRRVIFYTDAGVALVFDHFAGKWIVYRNQNAQDATLYGGMLTQIQAGGIVLQETPGVFTDDGNPILISLTTSVLSFAGIAGVQRVYRFHVRGDYRSAHTLSVAVAYNDSPAPSQVEVKDIGALFALSSPVGDTTLADIDSPGGGAFPIYEFVVKCAQQRCTSMQITISETQNGPAYGEGLSLSAMMFLVGMKQGTRKLPASNVI